MPIVLNFPKSAFIKYYHPIRVIRIFRIGGDYIKRKDLLIIKSDLEGRMFWSYTYKTDQHFDIKTAVADSKGGLVFVADAYGHSGGMMCAAVSPDGEIKWNNLIPSTPYEQVIDMIAGKDYFGIYYDKILNFGILKPTSMDYRVLVLYQNEHHSRRCRDRYHQQQYPCRTR